MLMLDYKGGRGGGSRISEQNEWNSNLAIHFLRGEGGSKDVNIILRWGWLLNGDSWLPRGGEGGEVKNLGKSDYIILTM